MTTTYWLASYPKSGNTWFRMLLANLTAKDGEPADINNLPDLGGMASSRVAFEDILMLDSDLLTHDEADNLRPRIYEELARGESSYPDGEMMPPCEIRFVKCHDAYTLTSKDEPLLAGARGAQGAIVIVRDPRDVVLSIASHYRLSADEAIDFLNDANGGNCTARKWRPQQLRQKLPGWSGHVLSWLEQRDIPIHLVRYEDLKRAPVEIFLAAMAFARHSVTRAQAKQAVAHADFGRLQEQERRNGFKEWPRGNGTAFFFRRGIAGGWRDDLTSAQVARIEREHAPMMQRLGYALSSSMDRGAAVTRA